MLGLQIYTVRDKIYDLPSAVSTVEKIKEIGYECVQLAGSMDNMKFVAEACGSVGMPILGILTSLKTISEQAEELLALARRCGAEDIGISAYSMTEECEAVEIVEASREFAARAAKEGISFSYHNHSNEFISVADGRTIMELMLCGFAEGGIDLMPDTYWLQHGGVDVRAFLASLPVGVKILHLKDMKRAKDGPTYAPLGEGNMNFPGIVEVAKQIGVRHYVVEQDICEGDSLECAARSYGYVKTLIGEEN